LYSRIPLVWHARVQAGARLSVTTYTDIGSYR